MKITNLKLTNFRNYENLNLTFSNYKNILIGPNGIGKTNIVEAIYYLAFTKSFRCSDEDLIYNGAEYAVIEGTILNRIKHNHRIILNKEGKKIVLDKEPVTRISDYISKINIIFFNREDLKLIKDNSAIHRKLMNVDISGVNNNYLKCLSIYNKILKQRNSYLKNMMLNSMIPKDYLDLLTEKLIDYGIQINRIRSEYIDKINNYLKPYYNKSVQKGDLLINYVSFYNNKTKEQLLHDYEKSFNRDLNFGMTHYGVHLDDFIFEINGVSIKNFLSDGEQKSAIIAFKLSEIKYCMEELKTTPILILDDMFSELDEKRINKIIGSFNKDFQIFITTTDLNKINKKVLNNCRVINIKNKKMEVKDYE